MTVHKSPAQTVHDAFISCLFNDDEVPADGSLPEAAVVVETFRGKVGLHRDRLASKREEIAAIVRRLEPSFRRVGEGAGHGMSFMRLPFFADGEHWAEHPTCDELLGLAFGLGMGGFLMPRKMWGALPGGMPYLWLDADFQEAPAPC